MTRFFHSILGEIAIRWKVYKQAGDHEAVIDSAAPVWQFLAGDANKRRGALERRLPGTDSWRSLWKMENAPRIFTARESKGIGSGEIYESQRLNGPIPNKASLCLWRRNQEATAGKTFAPKVVNKRRAERFKSMPLCSLLQSFPVNVTSQTSSIPIVVPNEKAFSSSTLFLLPQVQRDEFHWRAAASKQCERKSRYMILKNLKSELSRPVIKNWVSVITHQLRLVFIIAFLALIITT